MERRGLINKYTCTECNNCQYTVNMNHGVTPFGTTCSFCTSSRCYSNFYRLTSTSIIIQFCWYRPTVERFKLLNVEDQEWILSGALLPAAFGTAQVLLNDPVTLEMTGEEFLRTLRGIYVRN